MDYSNFSRDELERAVYSLEEELQNEQEKSEKLENRLKKSYADLKNYKKENKDRLKTARRKGRRELAEDLISVIDNFERALAAADKDSAIYQGVKMVGDQLYETLEKKGLERIDAEGEEFDPQIHNAVETRKHEEEDIVIEQKRPGYKHEDKILRPAEVVVSEKQD